jgi:hypothetical protein
MKESLATFRKAVNESADLQEKLKGGTDLVELGKENGHDFSQEDVTAAFEELKDSDEELTGFNAQLEAESGGSGSGSGGSSLVGSSLVKNSDEGTHRLPPVLTERNARVAVLKRNRDGSGSGSSGGSFGWLWCSGSLLVAAAVCCVCGVFCFSAEDESGFFSFSSLGVAFWWLCGLLVAAAVAVGFGWAAVAVWQKWVSENRNK